MQDRPTSAPPARLKSERIQARLATLTDWQLTPDQSSLRFTRRFDDPLEAVRFLQDLLSRAQERRVAPKVYHALGGVDVALWDPDEGGISEANLDFAEEISRLARRHRLGRDPKEEAP